MRQRFAPLGGQVGMGQGMVQDLRASWERMRQQQYQRQREAEQREAERRQRQREGDVGRTHRQQINSLCEMARRFRGQLWSGQHGQMQQEAIDNVLSNVPSNLREAVRARARQICPEFDSISDAIEAKQFDDPAIETPSPPEGEEPLGPDVPSVDPLKPDIPIEERGPKRWWQLPERPPTPGLTPTPTVTTPPGVPPSPTPVATPGTTPTGPVSMAPTPPPSAMTPTRYSGPAARATAARTQQDRYTIGPVPTEADIERMKAQAPYQRGMPSIPGGVLAPGAVAATSAMTVPTAPSAIAMTGRFHPRAHLGAVRLARREAMWFGAGYAMFEDHPAPPPEEVAYSSSITRPACACKILGQGGCATPQEGAPTGGTISKPTEGPSTAVVAGGIGVVALLGLLATGVI